MHKQGTASKLQWAHTTPRSGPRPFSILDGCRQILAIALRRAKGRDGGGKQFVGQRQKLLFEMESELTEELFQKLSGEPLNRFPPSGFIEQRGVVTCRNAPCLKRQRKRSLINCGIARWLRESCFIPTTVPTKSSPPSSGQTLNIW